MSGGLIGYRNLYSMGGVWSMADVVERIRQGLWPPYLNTILVDSPVGVWLLNETSGTSAADSSGNGNSGTYTGGYTLSQSGPTNIGPATLFNGSSGYVALGAPSALNLTSAWHLEAWVYLTSTPNGSGIITEQQVSAGTSVLYELGFGQNGGGSTLGIGYIDTGGSWRLATSSALSLNTWHLVGGEYDGTNLRLFVDGGQVATSVPSAAPKTGLDAVFIGRRHGTDASPYFPGRIAAAAIYPSAIGLARHQAHYNAINLFV